MMIVFIMNIVLDKLIKRMSNITKKIGSNNDESEYIHIMLILDDCVSEEHLRNSKIFQKLFTQGRHYKISIIFIIPTRTLRSHDITDVVCLLTDQEFRKFRVPSLLTDYENAGMIVYHLPIDDGMIPANVGAFTHLLSQVRE